MNNNKQHQPSCFDVGNTIDRIVDSEAVRHLGGAVRETLLAARAVVDAVIKSKEQRKEAKLQKVAIE
jgi:hypothetical protein